MAGLGRLRPSPVPGAGLLSVPRQVQAGLGSAARLGVVVLVWSRVRSGVTDGDPPTAKLVLLSTAAGGSGDRDGGGAASITGDASSTLGSTVLFSAARKGRSGQLRRGPVLAEGAAHTGGEEGPLRDEARRPWQQARMVRLSS